MNLKWMADHFDKMQYLLLGAILFVAWTGLRSQKQSKFKSREADRRDTDRSKQKDGDLASAKLNRKSPNSQIPRLALPGIRLTGDAHEILGVTESAREPEIMRAYKEKIKLFHPDRIQGQAREQLKFYEEASAKINQAKEEMLSRLKK